MTIFSDRRPLRMISACHPDSWAHRIGHRMYYRCSCGARVPEWRYSSHRWLGGLVAYRRQVWASWRFWRAGR